MYENCKQDRKHINQQFNQPLLGMRELRLGILIADGIRGIINSWE